MLKCWRSNNDNDKTVNTKGVGKKDIGSQFRQGGWDSPSEEKFKLGTEA